MKLSNEVLVFPSLENIGFDSRIIHNGILRPKCKIGEWITEGERMATLTFDIFRFKYYPGDFLRDYFDTSNITSIEIKAPVSGLVVGYQNNTSSYEPNYQKYDSYSFPIILKRKEDQRKSTTWGENLIPELKNIEKQCRLIVYKHASCDYRRLRNHSSIKDLPIQLSDDDIKLPLLRWENISRLSNKETIIYNIKKICQYDYE